jgi:uncharacterized membrane protein (DUF4010 family)
MDQQSLTILWDLLAALGIGLIIGIERGWSGRKEDEGDRIAGIRTFSLVGLLGGIWAKMTTFVNDWILAVIFLAFASLVTASYIIEKNVQKNKDIGITTEVSLLLTFSLGAWGAFGYHAYALGTAVIVIGFLSLKPVLHRWLRMIEVKEIYAGIQLLIISVIMLPLLPNQGYGPWQTLNPYWIWWMVVLISGLSFIGYILIKHLGKRIGTILTAITGAIASSTAVTLSLAQFAKKQKSGSTTIFTAGVLIASAIMFIRVFVEVAVVNVSLLHPLWIPLTLMLLIVTGGGVWLFKKHKTADASDMDLELKNPLRFFTALQFGVLLALILLLATAMQHWFGEKGIYLLALFSGLMDVDAITLSLSRMAVDDIQPLTASSGIIISVITNTLVKTVLFASAAGYKKSKPLIWITLLTALAGIITINIL